MPAGATAGGLPGQPGSLWLAAASSEEEYPGLDGDLNVDVAVLGGGIVGLTSALLLAREGASVALIEARRLGMGVSGHTTAKLSSLHGLTYDRLIRIHGEEKARAYGEANEAGIARVFSLADELQIECDLRRKPNYTFTDGQSDRESVESEAGAAMRLGLPASYTERSDLPFGIAGAVRFGDQAEFHPYRYLEGLAAALVRQGGRIYERTRAIGLGGNAVRTDRGGSVSADHVIVATHIPIFDRGLYFARTHPERSYALAVRLRGEVPQGMYLSATSPARSLRSVPTDEGELLIVGGESHKAGQGDPASHYRKLQEYACERFDVDSVEYRWAAQDNVPADSLAFIGALSPLSTRVLVATGFRKWGLALGTEAAAMLTDRVVGRENQFAEVFDPARLNLRASARDLVSHNVASGWHLLADRITGRGRVGDLRPGQGKVVGAGLGQEAVCRDSDGNPHRLSARCTHLGCIVRWNGPERTWDCPCHGSRFEASGEVRQGPAVRPLERRNP
jgi:glycine/D-amino acid oxidase-like deaminating enzyme/nitrite reductase/ring-hydroxylating ferredoxin subunit